MGSRGSGSVSSAQGEALGMLSFEWRERQMSFQPGKKYDTKKIAADVGCSYNRDEKEEKNNSLTKADDVVIPRIQGCQKKRTIQGAPRENDQRRRTPVLTVLIKVRHVKAQV